MLADERISLECEYVSLVFSGVWGLATLWSTGKTLLCQCLCFKYHKNCTRLQVFEEEHPKTSQLRRISYGSGALPMRYKRLVGA